MPCIFSARINARSSLQQERLARLPNAGGAAQFLSDLSAAEIDQRAMWTAGRRAVLAALQNATAKALDICLWASRPTMPMPPAGRSTNGSTQSCLRSRPLRSLPMLLDPFTTGRRRMLGLAAGHPGSFC
jgi:hypothetical protein